jgi:DNA-directed RNA polymerase subunit M/transcription elongation factor TFIIS
MEGLAEERKMQRQALLEALTDLEPEMERERSPQATAQAATAQAATAQAALRLERAVYNAAVREAALLPWCDFIALYRATAQETRTALGGQVGDFPDDRLGLRLLRGAATADEAVAGRTAAAPGPRETIRRMLVGTLMAAHARYAADRELVLETARAVEVSCYNAAVRASKGSEEPPRRQWDSPLFVDIYSTRCGAVNGLLDPASSTCRAYGATLVPRLLAGELAAEALGEMAVDQLCPQAMAAERVEITRRMGQKVAVRESNLFRCPHCSERRCTYQEVQRRSLDEAPDYLCLCLSCNRRFTGRS